MNGDYLWDGSGEPDPEIRKLEAALSPLRHRRPAPEFPVVPEAGGIAALIRSSGARFWPAIAGVAAGLVLIAALEAALRTPGPRLEPNGAASAWEVTSVEGSPRVENRAVAAGSASGKLLPGQTLETDSQSHASLRAEEFGEIDVEPGTRLRLLNLGQGNSRLALDRGAIHASIWAPPGEFVIHTPSATAVDLGCSYTLQVDDSGNGLLRTSLGWVGFKLNGHESFIPAGAACATKPKTGPGTPYFEDAPAAFRAALATLDDEGASAADHASALHSVLTQARKRDALTLWHLLSRVPESERGGVCDRLAKLVPMPSGVTREGVVRLDQAMLDQWWNKLDLGDIGLWRHWEQSWGERGKRKLATNEHE